jgi:hypothetical protein
MRHPGGVHHLNERLEVKDDAMQFLCWLLPSKVALLEEKRRCWTTKKQAKPPFHCLQLQERLMPTNKNELLV